MCLLCVEIQMDRIRCKEALKACGEMVVPEDHKRVIYETMKAKYGDEAIGTSLDELIAEDRAALTTK